MRGEKRFSLHLVFQILPSCSYLDGGIYKYTCAYTRTHTEIHIYRIKNQSFLVTGGTVFCGMEREFKYLPSGGRGPYC